MSASCVRADEIVVSEIGARLSPKIAPEMIAPHIKPMLMPKPWASGSSTGATAATEPVEVPQEDCYEKLLAGKALPVSPPSGG